MVVEVVEVVVVVDVDVVTVGGRVVPSVVLLWANILIEMTGLTGLTVVSLLGISEVLIFFLADGGTEELCI